MIQKIKLSEALVIKVLFFYPIKKKEGTYMKETILNQIILKTGDTIEIQEPANIPMNQKIMYKIEHEDYKVVVNSNNGKIVIPVENILFATSIPFGDNDEI